MPLLLIATIAVPEIHLNTPANFDDTRGTRSPRPLAIGTGAFSGIWLELARCCAHGGFDLLIAADKPAIEGAQEELAVSGISVDTVQADLSTFEGVDRLVGAVGERPGAALMANAGRGLGRAFLD